MKKTDNRKKWLAVSAVSPLLLLTLLFGGMGAQAAPALQHNEFFYLQQLRSIAPALSNQQRRPVDLGVAGAQLAVADSNTAGRFVQQHFALQYRQVETQGEALVALRQWLDQDRAHRVVLTDLPTESLLAVTALLEDYPQLLLLNVSDTADSLRQHQCRPRLLHTALSRAMKADALMQFLARKRWSRWLLIESAQAEDALFVQALERASKRFGGKFVARRQWQFSADLRRTAQQELPVFTQGPDYDVLLIADEIGDFGEFVAYNTWLPRPVAGTQGLVPLAWHPVLEQWGAAQLQNRFVAQTGRAMLADDYSAWLAVRAVAQVSLQHGIQRGDQIHQALLADDFELAGFKGRKLSFRAWNGQLRQPVPLVHATAMVSQSPQDGFLHPLTELDTLGFDPREVDCGGEQ